MAKFQNGAIGFYYCGRTAPHGYLIETEIIGSAAIFRVETSPVKNNVEILDKLRKCKRRKTNFSRPFFNCLF